MRAVGRATFLSSGRHSAVVALGVLAALGLSTLTAPTAVAAPEPRTRVIVQLQPGWDALQESRRAAGGGGAVSHVYRAAVNGFAGEFSDRAIALLQENPAVVSVEPDGVVTASDLQTSATWGLDRIDQPALPLSTTYTYPTAAGAGVTAYIVDSGIAPHVEFGDRLMPGYSTVVDSYGTSDCNGHGTHVASTVAGSTYGVAKKSAVVPVRVLDCNGSASWSSLIAGLDWVAGHHSPGVPAVANVSLGGGISSTIDAAVRRVIDDGVTVVIAAGNSSTNACNSSPARVPAALTVGATEKTDRRASFSSYGPCLDLFAPGAGITSAWHTGATPTTPGTATNTISGTSMAAPHVAGAAALFLSATPSLTPAAVASRVTGAATTGKVASAGPRSPDRLLFVGT